MAGEYGVTISEPDVSAKRRRGPIVATHLDSLFAESLRRHRSCPTVIALPDNAPRWELPSDIEVLITAPRGWREAPGRKPIDWPRRLRWIQTLTAGVDSFPSWIFDGSIVTSARGVNASALAEYVMTAVLMQEKQFDRISIRGPADWRDAPVGSAEGKIIGVAGFGSVGQAIAERALSFAMRVKAFRRGAWDERSDGVEAVGNLTELFETSDHVALAMPATPETRGIVNSAVLFSAKPGLHIVNVARGSLIEQDALLQALETGRIGAATLDVTSPEPPPEGHWLYRHPNVRLTPHIAWKGAGNSVRFNGIVSRNMDAFVGGRTLENMVDAVKGY